MADDKPNLASAKFSAEDEALFLETLEFYQTKYPRVNAPTRIAMKISRGDAFKNYLHFFVKALLIKGAPSVMTDLKELYADKEKVQIIEEMLLGWKDSMDKYCTLEGEND
jgi:hypothetical protein